MCAAGKKEIFWAQNYRNFACERSREEDFFFCLLSKTEMNAKVKLRRTINSFSLFSLNEFFISPLPNKQTEVVNSNARVSTQII